MTAKTRLHFARFEFKYVLPTRLRDEIERELGYFLQFDPFVASTPEHKYFVRSLYFDDPDFTAFYDKIDGLRTRSKFRLRTYSNRIDRPAPIFLELKGRHNNLVFKHRVPVGGEEALRLARGDAVAERILAGSEAGVPVREQFQFELLRKRIRPVALIDYYRRPYISRYDPEFRITFDERLRGTQTSALFPGPAERGRDLLPGYTVVEVKFRYHVPAWFHRIIQSYELRRVSISKICRGIEVLGLAENLS
ncbi:MAG TPA: polyphosphate polymerase domain-containing protein [Sedimenticola sp.]|nr:polyphosphate polymerase domain-containing protein [Sedimenticola sp.]